MISPTSFADVLAGVPSKREFVQSSYAAKIVKKLKAIYPITSKHVGYFYEDDDSPLDNIKHELDDREFNSIIIKHIKDVRLITLIRNPFESNPFKMFAENMRNEYNPGYSGVVFPVLNGGDFIIHNLGSPFERGFDHAKIVIQSKNSDLNDLVIEPLDNFIIERQRSNSNE